jgi:cytidylate kinase
LDRTRLGVPLRPLPSHVQKYISLGVHHDRLHAKMLPHRRDRSKRPLRRQNPREHLNRNRMSRKLHRMPGAGGEKVSHRRLCRSGRERNARRGLTATGDQMTGKAPPSNSERHEETMTSETELETANQAVAPSRQHLKVVAIDGPAAAGKTTVASRVAARLGAMLFDTGALYRAVTLAAIRAGVPETDSDAITSLARNVTIDISPPSVHDGRQLDVRLNGEDVTWAIRGEPVDSKVSAISAQPQVRQALLPIQRRIASGGPVVMVGRDIGSVVIPDAGVKIYLDASAEERARRRHEELVQRGVDVDYETVLNETRARDAFDSTREVAPLRIADEAVVVSTDGLSVDEVVDRIVETARERWQAAGVA